MLKPNRYAPPDESDLINGKAVARLLGRSYKTIYRWEAAGQLPAHVPSTTGRMGARRWDRRTILKFKALLPYITLDNGRINAKLLARKRRAALQFGHKCLDRHRSDTFWLQPVDD